MSAAELLERLQKRAMRWIVRQAFGTDPSELRLLLHSLNHGVLYHAKEIHELRRKSRDLDAEVYRSQFKIGQHDMRFLYVAQALLNDGFSRRLGVDLVAASCPTCLAPEKKACSNDVTCAARHMAALTRALADTAGL